MKIYSLQERREAATKATEIVRRGIDLLDVGNVLKEIGIKHKLHLDQLGILGEEIGVILYGLEGPTEFVGRICDRLGISLEAANAVAKDINEQIFLKIHEMIRDGISTDAAKINNHKPMSILEQKLNGPAQHTVEQGSAPPPTKHTQPDPYREPV